MKSARESLQEIVNDVSAMKAHESKEAALSTNKPWITASKTKIKRDSPKGTPIDGDHPETFYWLTVRTLHNLATIVKARRVRMEQGSHTVKAPVGSTEWERRKATILSEVDVDPIELGFMLGYVSDKPVREMRIRHGLDENSGRPLKNNQRPIISDRKRARK